MTAERILVVDDEPQIVRLCVQILGEMGYDVSGTEDGLAALDDLKDDPVDLLLVDIKMPQIDGLSLLRRAREIDPNLAAVIITGYATMDRAIEALRSGARGFVMKPFGMQDLALAVEEALARRRLEQERLRLQAQLPVLEVSQALMSEGDPISLAAQILEVVVRQTGAERALVVLPRAAGQELRVVASAGCGAGTAGAGAAEAAGLVERALHGEEPLVVEPGAWDGIGWPWDLLWQGGKAAHLVVVPLRTGKNDVGVLGLCWRATGPAGGLTASDSNLLSILGRQVAVALENARLYATEQQRTAELARALEQQQELDRLKDEFIRNVSHELRTPLALVLGYAELLADGVVAEPAADQVEPLRIIVDRCRKLTTLVENIATIVEARGQASQGEAVLLCEVVDAALADFGLMAERSRLSLEAEIAAQVPPVLGNRHQLRTVVDNLLDNACKFTPAGGVVSVRLYGPEGGSSDPSPDAPLGEVVFCVADTGIGIEPRYHAQIFDRFFQVDGTLRRTYGGSGLGLALVKEIVEAHRGSVQVESDLGQGSVFTVRLPAADLPE
jgi:signal transduction histidine kinase/DNA-binding response OmpR family regulator